MAKTTLDKIIEDVKTLTHDEQQKLREMLDVLLKSPSSQLTGDEFEQKLLELGVISEIKPTITDFRTNIKRVANLYLNR